MCKITRTSIKLNYQYGSFFCLFRSTVLLWERAFRVILLCFSNFLHSLGAYPKCLLQYLQNWDCEEKCNSSAISPMGIFSSANLCLIIRFICFCNHSLAGSLNSLKNFLLKEEREFPHSRASSFTVLAFL